MNRRDLLKAATGAVAGAVAAPLVAVAASGSFDTGPVYSGPAIQPGDFISIQVVKAWCERTDNADGSVSWTWKQCIETVWFDDRGFCVCVHDGVPEIVHVQPSID